MLSIISLLTSFQDPEALSVEKLYALPPEQVGELVLKDKVHRKIIAARRLSNALSPPNLLTYELEEEAVAIDNGCSKIIWNIKYIHNTTIKNAPYRLYNISSKKFIALAKNEDCEAGHYVSLGPNIDHEQGVQFLKAYEAIVSKKIRVSFDCDTLKNDDLCDKKRNILNALRATPPWHIVYKNERLEFWVMESRRTSLKVRFDNENLKRVSVKRFIPAPF